MGTSLTNACAFMTLGCLMGFNVIEKEYTCARDMARRLSTASMALLTKCKHGSTGVDVDLPRRVWFQRCGRASRLFFANQSPRFLSTKSHGSFEAAKDRAVQARSRRARHDRTSREVSGGRSEWPMTSQIRYPSPPPLPIFHYLGHKDSSDPYSSAKVC